MQYLRHFVTLFILLWAVPAFATVQFFPADHVSVGANSVEAILGDGSVGVYEALADGDTCQIITPDPGKDVCFYVLVDDAACGSTSAESPCPKSIKPDTVGACTNCCWELVDLATETLKILTSIELGHATDTTIVRSGAGDITVEGKGVYRADGTDVPVADGGTGSSSASTALVALGLNATAAEINTPLDGASVLLAEFQQLETIGASTISALQWALLGGLDATLLAAELNQLDGMTMSGSDVSMITGTAGTSTYAAVWNADGDLVDGPGVPYVAASATTGAEGLVELATNAETVTGTATGTAVTPDGLTARLEAPGEIGGTTPGVVNGTSFVSAGSATPGWTFQDTDDAAGTAYIYGNSSGGANDVIMSLGVEDSTGESTVYVELDGVTETIDLLKPVVVTGNIGATTYGSDSTISDAELLTLDNCALTEAFVGGGAGSAPVCTTVTGTGAPVLATSPILVTPLLGTPTSGVLTNCTGLPSGGITSIVDTIVWDAAGITADGTQCADPAKVQINSGPRQYTIICTDNDASFMFGHVLMPDSWDAGTVSFSLEYLQTAADTDVLNADVECQCHGHGETVDNT